MLLDIPKHSIALATVSFLCAGIAATSQVVTNINSDRAQVSRSKAQKIVTQQALSKSCWSVNVKTLKLGDVINISGGRSPTSCFKNDNQYAYAAYLNQQLQVIQVFSPYEVEATKSIIKGEQK